MSIENDLRVVLTPLCERNFPDVAPFATPTPYVTWQQIGGDPLVYVEGALPARVNAHVQINVWADTRLEANTLMRQIEAALVASTAMQALPLSGPIGDGDDTFEPRRYGTLQDFSIWATR